MPFIKQNYDIETREQKIVPIRLNHKEQLWLEALKKLYNDPKEATVFKKAAFDRFLILEKLEEILNEK